MTRLSPGSQLVRSKTKASVCSVRLSQLPTSPLQNTSGLVIMPGSLKPRNPWDPTAREHPCLAALPSALRVLFDGSTAALTTEDAPANSETRDTGLCSQVRGRASPSQGKATSRRCPSPPSQGSQRRPPSKPQQWVQSRVQGGGVEQKEEH